MVQTPPPPAPLMDAPSWPVIKDHFNDALDLSGEVRRRFLDGLEETTRAEVESLLEMGEGLLDAPLDTRLVPTGVERAGEALPGSAPGVESAGPLTDSRIGPYAVGERIGRGGMGDVYRARRADGLFDREVALKVVRDGADTDAVLARFAAERRILGSLEHPGIARLIAAGSEDTGPAAGQPWLALELVHGTPITDAVGPLDVEARVALLADTAEAVHHAHRRLVVHRDLKPSNVLVETTEGGTHVKLLDFGIAKLLDADRDDALTALHARRPMTRAYAAPEQVRDQPVTTATDVYGLGLLLFEVLTGRRPFPVGESVRQLEDAILDAPAPLPSAVTGEGGVEARRLRGDLDVICQTALAKEPEARYASAEALAADLGRWLAREPIQAQPPSTLYRLRRFAARNAALVAAAALIGLAILGGVASTLVQARQTRAEAARSEATADFLASVFGEADPTASASPLSALDLVDRGARRLDAELSGQPDVQARLLSVVAEAYLGLGRPDSARALARRALALRAPGGAAPDPAEAVRAQILIGRADFATDPAAGGRELATAVDLARQLGDDALLLDALEAQGTLAGNEVLSPTETVAVYEEAVDLAKRLEGRDSARLGRLLTQLAFKVSSAHQHGRIGPLLEEALESLPADRVPYERSRALVDYANLLGATGRLDEAQAAIDEAIALRRRVLAPGDPRTGEAIAAKAQIGTGDARTDERLAREALRMATAAGDDDVAVDALNALGRALSSQERYDEAVDVVRDRLELAKRVFGTESTRYPAASGNVARALHLAGRYDEAARAWETSIDLVSRAYGPTSAVTVSSLLEASWTERDAGRLGSAERLLARAYAAGDALGASSGVRARSALELGQLRLDAGRAAEAVAPLRRAVEGREALARTAHRVEGPGADLALALLGRALVASGAPDEGRALLTEALPGLEERYGAEAPEAKAARDALDRLPG